ncbi:MAG: M20/M25/M40 family metallo-hydrolase [Gemmatimonadota bacterium]
MAAHLADLGYSVTRQGVTPNRENLYATLDEPAVVLCTHLDVVPPHLELREDDEWLYGRGVQDAKGIAAAMVSAAVRLRDLGERRVALLFTVGEEVGSDGAKAATELGPKGRFLINGEPTENRLCIGQKGALHYILNASGVAAHSAYPEEGVSATEALLDTLARIRALPLPVDPLLGPTTLNIGRIQGGVATNVIPPHAMADLMFRTVAPTAELDRAIRAALAPNVKADVGFDTPFHKSPALPGWDVTTVSYASDLPHLRAWGTGYQMGPGTIRVAHTAHERVRKQDLRDGVDCYVRLTTDLITGAR